MMSILSATPVRFLRCLALASVMLVGATMVTGRDAVESAKSSLDPVPGYTDRSIAGWQIRVSDQLLHDQSDKTQRAIELLHGQLDTIVKILPPDVVESLREVPIWMSPKYSGFRDTAEYHPDPGWLQKAGRRPELARCVELSNINLFERECKRMPMMVLHELAHAYHHQVLGFDHAEIKAAYDQAVQSGSYESVLRGNGNRERAYGMNNGREYFAESSEAFFGKNDFFPSTRDELKKHDPRMHDLLFQLWNVAKPSPE